MKLKVLDLFSGIGGFSLGLERTGGFETVAFCEIEPFCQKVLKKHWPEVPIFEDVRTLDYEGSVDVISGGYPCQPFSFAGKRKGKEDDRHLWPAMFNLIKKYRPAWVIGENVAGHINMGLDSVLADLEGEGYGTRTFVIPAVACDAPHRRDRLWIIANSNIKREHQCGETGCDEGAKSKNTIKPRGGRTSKTSRPGRQPNNGEAMANPISKRGCSGDGRGEDAIHAHSRSKTIRHGNHGTRWPVEPPVGRVANGLSRRVDRLKGLGNAVVPYLPEIIGDAILQSLHVPKQEE